LCAGAISYVTGFAIFCGYVVLPAAAGARGNGDFDVSPFGAREK